MQNALKLKAGDILIFAKLANGELLLGGRTRTSADKDRKAPPRARKGSEQTTNGAPSAGIKRARTMNGTGGLPALSQTPSCTFCHQATGAKQEMVADRQC